LKRLVFLAALAVSACAGGNRGPDYSNGPPLKPSANPSAVIAAELAFSQLAHDKGQWTAFRETAAPDAEMFTPGRTKAAGWLKGRPDPALPVKWQPHAVWSSCDGSYAVTRGAWERPGATGSYVTVWQRQKKDGKYKWLVDMSLTDEKPAPPPEMIAAKVADCGKSAEQTAKLAAADAINGAAEAAYKAAGRADMLSMGSADDATLSWETETTLGARRVKVSLWNGAAIETVLDTRTASTGR
jgi:hypothetical protein